MNVITAQESNNQINQLLTSQICSNSQSSRIFWTWGVYVSTYQCLELVSHHQLLKAFVVTMIVPQTVRNNTVEMTTTIVRKALMNTLLIRINLFNQTCVSNQAKRQQKPSWSLQSPKIIFATYLCRWSSRHHSNTNGTKGICMLESLLLK
jgi:hypothetical protein